jgi:hypothetical protein
VCGDATRGSRAVTGVFGAGRVRVISSEGNGPGELVAIQRTGDGLGSKNDLLASSGGRGLRTCVH